MKKSKKKTSHKVFFLKLARQTKIYTCIRLNMVFLSRVRNLYHMLNTLVGQCRIFLRAKCTLKIYDYFQLLLDRMIESVFLFFQGMLNRLV